MSDMINSGQDWIKEAVAEQEAHIAKFATLSARCSRCSKSGTAKHDPCCSSHGRMLCCSCYRRTHFVEVRPCCSADAQELAR